MKLLRSLLMLTCISVFILSCEKEYSLEGGLTPAAGSLKSSTFGDCLPSTINGIFKKDTTLNSGNYIEVQLDFTSGGTYTIGSDTLNGYFFLGSGIITTPGLQTVKLFAIGKPFNAGTNNFTINYRNTQCFIAVTVVGPGGGANAAYTLGNTAGACTGAVLAGAYQAGAATTAANTATINVNVTTIGIYSITTTALNGVSFSKTGSFTALGAQTVVLQASGTPVAAGTFSYPVAGNTSTCSISVIYTPSSSTSVYTLQGAPGACTAAVVSGTYAVGTAMTSGNTVTIQANVTTAGTYSITTNSVNGISFAASGTFAATGTQQIVLIGVGTPTGAGNVTFTPQAGTSACTFMVTITGGNPTDFITGKLNGVLTTFNVAASALTDSSQGVLLLVDGLNTPNDSIPYFGFAIYTTATTLGAGTYTVNQFNQNILVAAYYKNAANVAYEVGSEQGQTQTPAFTIVITSITATRVSGTFSGPVKDNGGVGPGVINITEGTFSVPII